MKRVLMGALVAAFVCLAGSAAAEEAKGPAKKAAAKAAKPAWTVWAATDVKFADVADMKGIQIAPLWGDMKKGPWGSLFKWTPGSSRPGTRTPIPCASSSCRAPSRSSPRARR